MQNTCCMISDLLTRTLVTRLCYNCVVKVCDIAIAHCCIPDAQINPISVQWEHNRFMLFADPTHDGVIHEDSDAINHDMQ